MAYSTLAEGRDEQELERLDVELGMREDPAEEAVRMLREYQQAAGLSFDDPDAPVAPPPGMADEEFPR